MDTVSALQCLETAWASAREIGVLGSQSVFTFNDHAAGFVINDWRASTSVDCSASKYHFIDIGTGVGVPGILLAMQLPLSRWTLLDASRRRCDLAAKAVQAVGLDNRVSVRHARAGELARSPDNREYFDGATARLFGSVSELAECGLPLIRMGAIMVVSVSKRTEQQWRQANLLATTGCEAISSWSTARGIFLAIKRVAPTPKGLPRRVAARRRSPLI